MQPHQVVGIIDGDLSDAGAAGVRQVGVTVVDGESAETQKTIERTIQAVVCLHPEHPFTRYYKIIEHYLDSVRRSNSLHVNKWAVEFRDNKMVAQFRTIRGYTATASFWSCITTSFCS